MRIKDDQGKWTKASKIVATIGGIITIISSLSTGGYFITQANAWDSEVQLVEQSTLKAIQNLAEEQKQRNCDYIIDKLNELRAKERAGEMTEYDYVRQDQLEAKLERECQ